MADPVSWYLIEQGWEPVVVERAGRRLTFKVPPAMPAVDPAALVLMKHRA